MKKTITLILLIFISIYSYAQDFTGDWKGTIEVQGTKVELIFHITNGNDGLATTLDVPMQGASGIPLDKTTSEANEVTISSSKMGITYVGKLENSQLLGTYKQGGMELPLSLAKFENKLPGNTALPSTEAELKALAAKDLGNYKYKVEDYFAKPKASSFQLSPDGNYMSYKEKDANLKNHVYVKDIKTGEIKKVIEEKEELIRGYGWVNKSHLIYVMDKGGNENYHLFSVKIDGTNNKELTPFDGVKVGILAFLKEDPEHIIIQMNKNNPQINEPFKLNVETGELEQLFTNNDPQNPIAGYNFDKEGKLRGYSKIKDGIFTQYYYTVDGGKTFNLLKELAMEESFSILSYNYASENPDDAYVATNLNSDKTEIQLYDLKLNKPIKTVFSNPEYDVSGISLSRNRNYEVAYFSYEGEKSVVIPQSAYFKKLDKTISKQFPNYQYIIADYTDDESMYLIALTSDKLVGKYYTYDSKKNEFKFLYDLMPQLKEEDMAEMRPITFKSRDGKTIHGYITLPKAALEGKKVPLIVNPHGGPQGIRDHWGFNPETQLFASRGYATLQVNFRISGGYGKEFFKSGFKQIGRKLMDDVEDGLQYSIDQGWVDKEKVAIYGASHGGYAVLRGMEKTPDLYTCGVDYVGVSNIFTFMNSMPAYWKPYLKMIKEIWYDIEDPKEEAIAKEVSPVYHIDAIKKPLFVIQGGNDPRVNINESDQIVEGLRKKGFEVPYMVKYNEGHGFGKEENQVELYKTMLGFLAVNLK
ncbi:alpha/beta hydrolase family protein [Lacihabitans lacunae]|uniref:Alpha/beta hydrolase family protein n=1 Tax=Lacihabitans lacunae TaxID=1028214 RepID=A0ABV7YX90_9BACT